MERRYHTPRLRDLCALLSLRPVGRPDQFAKDTFAEETPRITRGAISWQDPPELRLVKLLKLQGDGLLRVHRPEGLGALAPPWS